MLISNVKVNNFRCYYGTSNISLNKDGRITLIYGDSGYGKSSLLQFFRWMFYNNPDFGKTDDKPLFNIAAYNESAVGSCVEVGGQIDFDHMGTEYRLIKRQLWKVALRIEDASIYETTYQLFAMGEDGGYHPYNGDVLGKINTFLPKGLSKYFLLDGEKARDIVLDSNELKKAIHALFGLDAYNEAITHVGYKTAKNSIIGFYNTQMAAKAPKVGNSMSLQEMLEALQDLSEKIEFLKLERDKRKELLSQKKTRRDEIFRALGASAIKENAEALIRANERSIKDNEDKIKKIQIEIGNLFYRNYPYLILAKKASASSCVLRKKKEEYAASYTNVFKHLRKELLEEIKNKKLCICGRDLDEKTAGYINGLIDIMPPDSYVYRFRQFVSLAKEKIKNSELSLMQYGVHLEDIANLEAEIETLEDINKQKLEELKRIEDAKDLVEELQTLNKEIVQIEKEKDKIVGEIDTKVMLHRNGSQQYQALSKSMKVSAEYDEKISFFEEVLVRLKQEKKDKELKVKLVLNDCVKEIFRKLTTQNELDIEQIQFVNDDFSLRTTYLTGGQLAVDVYSYVIGIIKALQEFKLENNESPIIIDAPFAFTGNEQSEHLFKTLPEVSKQTLLLTLDLNKIKKLLSQKELYNFYEIENASQDKAIIKEGIIDDIKF